MFIILIVKLQDGLFLYERRHIDVDSEFDFTRLQQIVAGVGSLPSTEPRAHVLEYIRINVCLWS